jgi:hypothetical protein
VTSERIPDGLAELGSSWSFDDLMQAHDVLDAFDEAEAEARRQAEGKRPRR